MSAAAALAHLQAAGVHLELRADGTVALSAGIPPPPELLAEARAHKAELLGLLRADAQHELAAVLLAGAERGAAAVAAGPSHDIEPAEAEVIRQIAAQPAPEPPERHWAHVPGLFRAALLRPPSWSDPAAAPGPGSRCSCCSGTRWWTEAQEPTGWRCAVCHPPNHLPSGGASCGRESPGALRARARAILVRKSTLLRDLGRAAPIGDTIAWIRDPAAPLPSHADEAARAWLARRIG